MNRNWISKFWAYCMAAQLAGYATALAGQDSALLMTDASAKSENSATQDTNKCLPNDNGFFRARLGGSINAELDWHDASLECTGASRPSGGARLRFSHAFNSNKSDAGEAQPLIFVLGIPTLREGINATALAVNITVIRQGSGRFFGTMGDSKCLIDSLQQKPLTGIPKRNRSYKVTGRGFCSQPAQELSGEGLLHITRFDFAGRIDYTEEDDTPDTTIAENANQDTQQ